MIERVLAEVFECMLLVGALWLLYYFGWYLIFLKDSVFSVSKLDFITKDWLEDELNIKDMKVLSKL